jgi:hypothetical protein
MLVPFGEWIPDAAPFGLTGLAVATNCVAAAEYAGRPLHDEICKLSPLSSHCPPGSNGSGGGGRRATLA